MSKRKAVSLTGNSPQTYRPASQPIPHGVAPQQSSAMLQLHGKNKDNFRPFDILMQIFSLQFDPLNHKSLFLACKMTHTPYFCRPYHLVINLKIKKMKKVLFSLIAVATMAFAFVSCGGNNGKEAQQEETVASEEVVVETAQQNGLVGNWYYEDDSFYTFNEDGTGSYTYTGELFGNFTYSEADGKLTLNYEGSDPTVFNYTLEGDVLTILAGESNYGADTQYRRR